MCLWDASIHLEFWIKVQTRNFVSFPGFFEEEKVFCSFFGKFSRTPSRLDFVCYLKFPLIWGVISYLRRRTSVPQADRAIGKDAAILQRRFFSSQNSITWILKQLSTQQSALGRISINICCNNNTSAVWPFVGQVCVSIGSEPVNPVKWISVSWDFILCSVNLGILRHFALSGFVHPLYETVRFLS